MTTNIASTNGKARPGAARNSKYTAYIAVLIIALIGCVLALALMYSWYVKPVPPSTLSTQSACAKQILEGTVVARKTVATNGALSMANTVCDLAAEELKKEAAQAPLRDAQAKALLDNHPAK